MYVCCIQMYVKHSRRCKKNYTTRETEKSKNKNTKLHDQYAIRIIIFRLLLLLLFVIETEATYCSRSVSHICPMSARFNTQTGIV